MSGHKTLGAGQPLYFKCAKCRLTRNAGIGGAERNRQTLTGRTRGPYGNCGQRMDKIAREYRCDCGHVGWSRHKHLALLFVVDTASSLRYSTSTVGNKVE